MTTGQIALFAGAAVVVAGGLVLALRMNPSSTNDAHGTIGAPVETRELNPYSHIATIPAIVDPATIRFEKMRTVDVASKTKTTTDAEKCRSQQFQDPDGSNCQTTTVEEKVKAVEAVYSYAGPVVAAGEATPGRDSFSVYFRPEEVGADGAGLKRNQAESFFQLTTSRSMVQQKVVDSQHSKYCDGSYVDGNWVRKDSNCQDQVQFINQIVPSPYMTVQVELRHPVTVATR